MQPLVRAQECLKQHFEGKIPLDEWAELKKKLELIRKADQKGINKLGLVDVDEFCELILSYYRRMESLAAERVFELFKASDFNNNSFMSADEFQSCFRNLLPLNPWGKDYALLLFQDYMEEVPDGQGSVLYGLGFEAFLHLALEMDILKVKDQNEFLCPMNLDRQYAELN